MQTDNHHDTPMVVELDLPDCDGPLDVFDGIRHELRYPFLLDSADGPLGIARYTLLGGNPFLVFRCHRGTYRLEYADGRSVTGRVADPFHLLDELIRPFAPASQNNRFAGCAVGYIGYDAKNYIETLPDTVSDDLGIPEICFGFYDTVVVFDRATATVQVVACSSLDDVPGLDKPAADRAETWTRRVKTRRRGSVSSVLDIGSVTSTHTFAAYREMVLKCKDYISAGDIFQANLSQRLGAEFRGDPFELYRRLRSINPSPFAFYMDWDDIRLVSCSPERLVRTRNGIIDTRPIAGTRPRGRTLKDDEALRRDLRLNEKESAEHIMIVDMARNDIGRVCRYGTVTPDELRVIEQYSHVFHIVSNISGRMRTATMAADVVRAVFPGASITGVPKIRCMEIIDELEPVRRGPYTGSAGYIGFNGEMDFNIIIRTFVVRDGSAYIQVGGGIVADSEPRHEFDETLHKAQALIEALNR